MKSVSVLLLLCFLVALVVAEEKVQFKAIIEQVHEDITERAAKNVGGFTKQQFKDLKTGTQWPDAPCENEKITICLTTPAKTIFAAQCSFSFQNDFGQYSVWHSMAVPGSLTNQQNLDKLLAWTQDWYNKGLHNGRGAFWIGKICHQVGDAYSHSHVWRNDKKQVMLFQRYGDQDSKKHAKADKRDGRGTFGIPGANAAVTAIEGLLRLFKAKKQWHEVDTYLRTKVYNFAPGAANKPAGGSHPDYSCGKLGCGLDKIKKPKRSTAVTITNKSKVTLTLTGYSLPHGCWTCYNDQNVVLAEPRNPQSCSTIKAGASCTFKSESCGILTGTEGSAQYTGAGGKSVNFKYDNPFIGKNKYKCDTRGLKCSNTKGKGNNASVTFTVK